MARETTAAGGGVVEEVRSRANVDVSLAASREGDFTTAPGGVVGEWNSPVLSLDSQLLPGSRSVAASAHPQNIRPSGSSGSNSPRVLFPEQKTTFSRPESRSAEVRIPARGSRKGRAKIGVTSPGKLLEETHAIGGSREELGQLGLSLMRANGVYRQFKNILSSAAKNINPIVVGDRTSSRRPSAPENTGIALINLESTAYPKYTEESGETGSKPTKSADGGLPSANSQTLHHHHRSNFSTRLARKRELYQKRRLVSDYALFFALLGLVLMILENEMSAAGFYDKASAYSYALKTLILASTLGLLGLVSVFHVFEVQLFMNDNSAEDWRIAMTVSRVMSIGTELTICAISPIPANIDFAWTTIHADGETVTTTDVPLDVLLSIPMFMRLYLIGRVMLLHSRLFTDTSSRSIGALNRVNFNARFVLKTLMTLCPGTVLLVITASFWVMASWVLRLCERYHTGEPPNIQALKHQNYLNSLWLIAITFLSVGYGDIVPNTYCGRAVAVITGIMGAGTASMVVAVIARKLELSRAEKHVHTFMMDNQLTKKLKHAAANVLRETWLIYKHRRLTEKIDPGKIRAHQRKFLVAIYELRKVKRDQRKLQENSQTIGDIAKTASNTLEMVADIRAWHETIDLRLNSMEEQLQLIRNELHQLVVQISPAPLHQPSPVPSLRSRTHHRPSLQNGTRTTSE